MQKDFEGTDLMVGDGVVIVTPNDYSLQWGTVVGFTPRKIKVTYMGFGGKEVTTTRNPNQIYFSR